ncbi:hypothetical protein N9H93_03545 [Rhizobiaceae bacterium]|nr:hypothetical protein [Rhizobiaceae bacterium]
MAFALPTMNARFWTTTLAAGALATVAFDLFGQSISPMLGALGVPLVGAKLSPVGLANQSLGVLTGIAGKTISGLGLGHGLHTLTGLIAYPLGYALLARPISNAVAKLPWVVTGVAYGIVLFVFALYVMAHLVSGNPPFLGWGGITWVALWGHIIFGVVVAAVYARRVPETA